MLSKFNVILTVTQKLTSQKVNTSALRMEGINLMTHLRSSFLDERGNPWVQIIPSVHQMCAHAWQLFEMNKGDPISKWSENPLVSQKKRMFGVIRVGLQLELVNFL